MIEPLSVRLQTVYDTIDPNRASKGRVIDVGSDHGLLALNCLKRELTPFCICTDIHSAPAARTAECLSSYNLDGRFEVFCTDGLDGVDLKKDDTVVMAGLGGNTAVDVMTRAMKLTSEDTLREIDFVLQPQKSQDRVREFLYSNGFAILDETAAIDRDLFYICMKVRYDCVVRKLESIDKYFGPILRDKTDPDSLAYIAHLKEVYEFRRRGDAELNSLLEATDV